MATEEIEEIGKLPDSVEDITKDPILKPLLDYSKMALMLEIEDKAESQYRNERVKELDELLKTGIYETSMIAIAYSNLLEIYKRLLLIMARYTGLADKKMGEIKEIVHTYYITKTEYAEKINEIKNQITNAGEENKKLLERNKLLKEENQKLIKELNIQNKKSEKIELEFERIVKKELEKDKESLGLDEETGMLLQKRLAKSGKKRASPKELIKKIKEEVEEKEEISEEEQSKKLKKILEDD